MSKQYNIASTEKYFFLNCAPFSFFAASAAYAAAADAATAAATAECEYTAESAADAAANCSG